MPHLIGLATAANIGSTGTITGNPQNIYIGSHAGISYLRFALRLLPVAVLGLGPDYLVIALVYRGRLACPKGAEPAAADRNGDGAGARSGKAPAGTGIASYSACNEQRGFAGGIAAERRRAGSR